MIATTPSRSSVAGNGERLDPDEIRRIVEQGKQAGLIRAPGAARPVAKNGEPVTAAGKQTSQWMDVTPALAAQWLENNFRNRPISDDVVDAYARDMLAGQWVATHQGIAFNDKDELIDGQHRLQAILKANVTVRMMVTFGLPSEIAGKQMTTMDCVDRGRTRSVSDQLKIQHGMKDGAFIAALCAQLATICSCERTRRLSVGQTLEVYHAFEPSVKWMIANRPREIGVRSTGVLAAFVFARAGSGTGAKSAEITAMFERLVAGEKLKPTSALGRLREFLTSDEVRLLTRGTDRALAELVLEAIRLELAGKPVAKLELGLGGVTHFRALQKERVAKIAAFFKLPVEAKK